MTPTDFCKIVESRLGWETPDRPLNMRYITAAGQVTKKQATDPDLYSWDNLLLAVELLAQEKESRSPVGVFAHVERALAMATEDEADIEHQIRDVIAYETERGDPTGWAVRLSRATGHYRQLALNEWKESVL